MKKSARQWFLDTLPEEVAGLAFWNTLQLNEDDGEGEKLLSTEYNSFSNALNQVFCWEESEQGHNYWLDWFIAYHIKGVDQRITSYSYVSSAGISLKSLKSG